MAHTRQHRFVYVHEWALGDLAMWGNRCLVHAATWFNTEKEQRVTWRITVSGNPGELYAREHKSWLPGQQAAE